MRKKIPTLALLIIIPIFSTSYAEKVNPEFSGEWYENATPSGTDSCFVTHWTYENKSNSKDDLINKLFNGLPSHDNCQWKKPYLDGYAGSPQDFPTFDFDEVVKNNPNAPKPEYWESECKSSKGTVVDRVLKTISPSYRCPNGSRIVWGINPFCSTTPNVCMSDVVGRNLDYPGMGGLGHVGLTTMHNEQHVGNFVLEVLANDPKIINVHTLESFEKAVPGKYWGEVYDLPEHSIYINEAHQILSAGFQQQAFDPEYTIWSQWQEGRYLPLHIYDTSQHKFLSERKFIRAKFRCDSFVYYCFLKTGIKIQLAEMLPKQLFKNFLHRRKDVPPQSLNSNKYYDNKEITNLLTQDINEAGNPAIDKIMMDYLENPIVSRQTKINTLFKQLNTCKTYNQFSYILDVLSSLRPVELIPNLIKEFHNHRDVNKKVKLLSAITGLTQIIGQPSDDNANIKNIESAQNLIVNILQSEANMRILRESISDSLSVLPMSRENYLIIVDAMNRLESDPNNPLDVDKKNLYLLSMAFANDDMQKWLLPKLLAKPINNKENDSFNKQLFFIIRQLSPSQIDRDVKLKIEKYIHSLMSIDKNNASFDQLYALSTVTSKTVNERNIKLLSYILDVKQPQLQADLIGNVDKETLLQLSTQDREKLHSKFLALFNKAVNYKDKRIYALAYSQLK